MESPVLSYHKNRGPQLTLIQEVRTISEQDTRDHEKWRLIKDWYEEVESNPDIDNAVNRGIHSIINAIVYQERKAFCLGFYATRKLRKQDSNWKSSRKNVGMANSDYKKIIARLTNELKIIELVYKGNGKQLSAYKVVHPSILAMINGKTMEEQIEESIAFAKNNKDLEKPEHKQEHSNNPLLLSNEKTNDNNSLQEPEHKQELEVRSKKLESNTEKPTINLMTLIRSRLTITKDLYEMKEEVQFLAEIAEENCDISVDSVGDRRKLAEYINGKVGYPKNSKYGNILADVFFESVADIIASKEVAKMEIKEPEIVMENVKNEIEKERRRQEKVGAMLKIHFGKDSVEHLREELAKETDELERQRLQAEIEIWGG